jgi:hypothetical protein
MGTNFTNATHQSISENVVTNISQYLLFPILTHVLLGIEIINLMNSEGKKLFKESG